MRERSYGGMAVLTVYLASAKETLETVGEEYARTEAIHEDADFIIRAPQAEGVSEEEMRATKPDYLLVLPWHFIDSFVKREQVFLEGGGAFIVPCPRFEVIRG